MLPTSNLPSRLERVDRLEQLKRRALSPTYDVFPRSSRWARWQLGIPLPGALSTSCGRKQTEAPSPADPPRGGSSADLPSQNQVIQPGDFTRVPRDLTAPDRGVLRDGPGTWDAAVTACH